MHEIKEVEFHPLSESVDCSIVVNIAFTIPEPYNTWKSIEFLIDAGVVYE